MILLSFLQGVENGGIEDIAQFIQVFRYPPWALYVHYCALLHVCENMQRLVLCCALCESHMQVFLPLCETCQNILELKAKRQLKQPPPLCISLAQQLSLITFFKVSCICQRDLPHQDILSVYCLSEGHQICQHGHKFMKFYIRN